MNELNKSLIKNFWRKQSLRDSNRWTDSDLLEFEISYLTQKRPQDFKSIKILDMGSGSGELSKRLQEHGDILIAVDFEENYRRFFRESDSQFFTHSDVIGFESEENFDIILLCGVVTHLTTIEENQIYEKVSKLLAPRGFAVIKHQMSINKEFIVNTYSEALAENYSARYSSFLETEVKLKSIFQEVEFVEYPKTFNKFDNSKHVAFLVKK